MQGIWKVTKCEARQVEIEPPHDYTVKTGQEPGVPAIIIECSARSTTNLWPPGTGSSHTTGLVFNKRMAIDLSTQLKDLANLMKE